MLIHSAAGGVGYAAIQIAQMIGAEVYFFESPAYCDMLISLSDLCDSRKRGEGSIHDGQAWTLTRSYFLLSR